MFSDICALMTHLAVIFVVFLMPLRKKKKHQKTDFVGPTIC